MAQILGSLIHHEAAALHPDGVAAGEVGVQVSTVAHALMVPTLEISVLVEYYLQIFVRALINSHSHFVKNVSRPTYFHSVFSVRTHNKLTFPIVILVGVRLMLN